MTMDLQATIKAWAKKQPDDPGLAAAIRRLVELGLKAKGKRRAHVQPAGPGRSPTTICCASYWLRG